MSITLETVITTLTACVLSGCATPTPDNTATETLAKAENIVCEITPLRNRSLRDDGVHLRVSAQSTGTPISGQYTLLYTVSGSSALSTEFSNVFYVATGAEVLEDISLSVDSVEQISVELDVNGEEVACEQTIADARDLTPSPEANGPSARADAVADGTTEKAASESAD